MESLVHFRIQSEATLINIPKKSIRNSPYLDHFEIGQRGQNGKKKGQNEGFEGKGQKRGQKRGLRGPPSKRGKFGNSACHMNHVLE